MGIGEAWMDTLVSHRRGPTPVGIRIFVMLASLLLTVGACLAGPAQAARNHPLLLEEALPEAGSIFRLAVSQTTGHFYVVAGNTNGTDTRIYFYEPNGQIDPVSPELTLPLGFEPFAVAVDNSGGPQAGYVYASDLGRGTRPGSVQQFDAAGEATAVRITESSIPPNGTPQASGLPPVVNPGGFEPRSLAVDKSGNLYVGDSYAEEDRALIDKFTPAGTFIAQFSQAKKVTPEALAIDAAGDVYVASNGRPEAAYANGLVELNASGECVLAGCTPIDSAPLRGVAVADAQGTIYTVGTTGSTEGAIREYDATTHDLLGVTTGPQLSSPLAVGVEEATGDVLVANWNALGGGSIQIYGPVEVVPDVKTLPAENITDSAVTLKGEIGAAEVSGATCTFQYVTAEQFAAGRFEKAAEVPCEPAGPFSGTAMNSVSAHVKDLRGGTAYHERIVGTNENGSNPGQDIPFETLGPSVTNAQAIEIGRTAATLTGVVNPNGSLTSYHFEYLTQARFEEAGWNQAIKVPAGGESIGAGIASVKVSTLLTGLAPGTAYRFRIVAASGSGETVGEEGTFATFAPPRTELPDGRRYEQASPIDKNGANVQGGINSVQASIMGSRVTFFTNTGIPGGEGSQQFPTYLASREPDNSGWSIQGLLPAASFGPRAYVLGWTEDLGDTYDYATPAFGAGRLLRRSSADGVLTQAGTIESKTNPFAFAGSSKDGGVALLESAGGGLLPEDLVGKQNLYAYDRETHALAVAGVLNPTAPGAKPTVPPGGAMAGSYDWFQSGPFGGALGFYFTQAEHGISTDGTKVFFTAGGSKQLYVRENPLEPQSAMSGGVCTEAEKACTIRISAPKGGVADPETPAAFVGASAEGHLVYFLDRGKLTPDATGGSGYDLYRYDLQSGELTDVTRDTADVRGARVEGVLGIGADGGTVYLVAAGKLSAEAGQAPAGETNLYALEGDEAHLIVRLGTEAGGAEEPLNWSPQSRSAGGLLRSHASRVSPDGHTLLFSSGRQLTAYDSHGVSELYLYRSGAGISCISCNPSGQAPAGPAGMQQIPDVGISLSRTYSFMTRNLSADGRRVIFDSADRLVGADENNVNDVYEWEADGKGSCADNTVAGGCLFLISGGAKAVGPSWFGDADKEGENIFFFTAQQLVAQDKDELVDIYDARVGGGIAAQEALPSTPCREEADCLPSAESGPSISTPRSPGVNDTNVVPLPHCKRGFVRRHGKCVRRHKMRNRSHRGHHHKSRHHGKGKQRQHGRADNGGGR